MSDYWTARLVEIGGRSARDWRMLSFWEYVGDVGQLA